MIYCFVFRMNICDATKTKILQNYLAKLPDALVVQGSIVQNQRFRGNIITIADEIKDVATENGTLLAFASSYQKVVIGEGTINNEFVMFIRKNTLVMNIDIIVLKDAHLNMTFLCENPYQLFEFDGRKMNVLEFTAWWTKNKVHCAENATKGHSNIVRTLDVDVQL